MKTKAAMETPMVDRPFDPVLEFWFGSLNEGFADSAHQKLWFNGGPEADAVIGEKFQTLISDAAQGRLTAWLDQPRGRLAFILVCDQFPRNVFRGTSDAFASDAMALEAARTGIGVGADRELGFDERAFFYLPFEHSENLVDQHACVGLFTQMRDETPRGQRQATGEYLRHAHQHRDIITRFGRFPHRNTVLGRVSSPEEAAYIAGGGGFGQEPR